MYKYVVENVKFRWKCICAWKFVWSFKDTQVFEAKMAIVDVEPKSRSIQFPLIWFITAQ